jgi:hypothetical protein
MEATMSYKYLALLLALCLFLTACAGPSATDLPMATDNQSAPTSYPEPVIPTSEPVAYPYPGALIPTIISPYPEPVTSGTDSPEIPPSGYEPQPADANLKRDKVFIELENSSLTIMESFPIQVNANLTGSLSDPCHELRVVVTPANTKNQINLEVYSVVDPSKACITVIEPFSAPIPLGSYTDGHYSVNVNGELLGEFDA